MTSTPEFASFPSNDIALAYRSDATVLITGPTGSGKSRLAREIHDRGSRRLKPFVTVNLASLHEGTLESELFGHERGAYTGADQRRIGRIEGAQGGTVFLDEIGELSPRLQARLLEFLQSRTIVPVGSNRVVKLDVRVIVATHCDLRAAIKKGLFREDLFHRLRVLGIRLPGLVEQAENFDSILHSCLTEVCIEHKRSVLRLSEEVATRFENYLWPGNIRELRNVLEYAVLSSDSVEITSQHLPAWFGEGSPNSAAVSLQDARLLVVAEVPMTLDFQATLSRFEKHYLERALGRFGGRVNRTAREIGMNKTTLIRRIRAHRLEIGRISQVNSSG